MNTFAWQQKHLIDYRDSWWTTDTVAWPQTHVLDHRHICFITDPFSWHLTFDRPPKISLTTNTFTWPRHIYFDIEKWIVLSGPCQQGLKKLNYKAYEGNALPLPVGWGGLLLPFCPLALYRGHHWAPLGTTWITWAFIAEYQVAMAEQQLNTTVVSYICNKLDGEVLR